MTSDFENDEIKDAAFPVDFSDDGESLDIYGVWVKSGPRDASSRAVKESFPQMAPAEPEAISGPVLDESVIEEPFIDEAILAETMHPETDTLPDLSSLSDLQELRDISELPDLPDTIEESVNVERSEISETARPDDSVVPVESAVVESAFIEQALPDMADFTALPEIDDITSIGIDEATASIENADLSSISFETIDLVAEREPATDIADQASSENVEAVADEASFNTVDMSDFLGEIAPETAGETAAVEADSNTGEESFAALNPGDVTFEAINPDELGTTVELDETLDLPEEPRQDSPEEEISLDSFVSETEPTGKKDSTPVAEDDFSDFLDDLNSLSIPDSARAEPPRAEQSDSLDLDSFIDSFNETGGASAGVSEQLYDDIDPVDLELEFDESFIEDSEKIKATGASVTESEFFNSEFGVELIDETQTHPVAVSPEDESNFDEMFGVQSGETASPSDGPDLKEYEQTDEFDDLLNSLDSAPIHTGGGVESKPVTQKQKIFDLTVTEEDSLDTPTSEISEMTDSQDFDVSLSGSISAVKEEKLDLPEIRDYNSSEPDSTSEPEMDVVEEPMISEPITPEFDDIRALEQELSDSALDTGDETVVANDKSTELLMIIADELSSIKNEITTLKTELSAFKAAGLTAEPAMEPMGEPAPENSGFFSDDDTDETIALTGDELNNILITADFTEEKGESESPSDEGIPQTLDELTSSLSTAESTEITSDEEVTEIPETLPDSLFDMPAVAETIPIEATHVNTLEGDVSYLEGSESVEPELSNVAIDENEIETIDFNDEKLEEPVLTEFNIDLSEIEEHFTDDQAIPTAESATTEVESPETIDIPLSPDFAISAEPEVSFDEPVLETVEPSENVAEPLTSSEKPVSRETTDLNAVEAKPASEGPMAALPIDLKNEIKSVLSYMDQLLESLPEDKIEEFAKSEHFEVYKKLFEELGIS